MTLSWNQKRNTIGAFGVDPSVGAVSWGGQEGANYDDDFSMFGMGGKSGALGSNDVLGKQLDKSNPWLQSDLERKKSAHDAEVRAQELYGKTQGLNSILNSADTGYESDFAKYGTDYMDQASRLVADYTKQIDALKKQSHDQATNAASTYTNSIQPGYKDAMALARQTLGIKYDKKGNAIGSDAMTLAEAGDANNEVQKSVRAMYDKQGQAANKQGQQDFGTLSALGAQAAQGQFGAGGPMTSGQMGQIYAANQNQAGDAYAKAQQRMYDLQQQGIDKGFDQSNKMFQFGQDAQQRLSNATKDFQVGEDDFYGQQRNFRDEQSGYAGNELGVNSGLNADRMNIGMMGSDIHRQGIYGSTGREQQAVNQLYGAQGQIANNDLAAGLANNASKGQFYSTILSMFAGGMGGGAAGAAGAGAAGGGRQPGMIQQRQPDYNSTGYDEYGNPINRRTA